LNVLDGKKPAIHIFFHSTVSESEICQIFYGIEEEQVPFAVQTDQYDNALDMSYEAAKSSRLDVGIGICDDRNAILHYSKLNKNKPLFQLKLDDQSKSQRALGANAARLVKRIPFKGLEINPIESNNADNDQSIQLENVTKEQIKAIVKRILMESK